MSLAIRNYVNKEITLLESNELIMLLTLRLWALPYRHPDKKMPDWRQGLQELEADEHTCAVCAMLFTFLFHYSRHRLDVRCTCNTHLGKDEAEFLVLLSALQQDDITTAETILTHWVDPCIRHSTLVAAINLSEALRKLNVFLGNTSPARLQNLAFYIAAPHRVQ